MYISLAKTRVNEFVVHYKVEEKHHKRVEKLQNVNIRFSSIKNIKTGIPRLVDMP